MNRTFLLNTVPDSIYTAEHFLFFDFFMDSVTQESC